MADTKISELPVASAIASPDIAPVVRGGVTMQADVSLFGGSYRQANTARVDPIGSDATGEVGDISKPFKTVQAALTALEAQGGFLHTQPAMVLLPMLDTVENVTTSIPYIVFCGEANTDNQGAPAIGTVTLTDDGTGPGELRLGLTNVYVNGVSCPNASTATVYLAVNSAIIVGPLTTPGAVDLKSPYGTGSMSGTITAGLSVLVEGFKGNYAVGGNSILIDSPGQNVELTDSFVENIISAATIRLVDSRLGANSSGVTPTYSDVFLNPALMDFSTLPQQTNDSGLTAGQAWIDTTAGLNVVKVKL